MKYKLILYDKEMFERKEVVVTSEQQAKVVFDGDSSKFGFLCTMPDDNIVEKYIKE